MVLDEPPRRQSAKKSQTGNGNPSPPWRAWHLGGSSSGSMPTADSRAWLFGVRRAPAFVGGAVGLGAMLVRGRRLERPRPDLIRLRVRRAGALGDEPAPERI